MKTYDRDTFVRARAAWDEGAFGPAWSELRRISWERGFPFPPAGTEWDSVEDAEPSQRAIVWHWLEDRPVETTATVARSWSWSQVVRALMGMAERVRDDVDLAEREDAWDRDHNRARPRDDTLALAAILRRLGDSVGVER